MLYLSPSVEFLCPSGPRHVARLFVLDLKLGVALSTPLQRPNEQAPALQTSTALRLVDQQ